MTLNELVKIVISSEHGSKVADQFESTFVEFEPFFEQDQNDLNHIKSLIKELLESEFLNEKSTNELKEYFDELNIYFSQE